ncbi:MAG: folate-binding protein, partial [Alphaproteobacteria bacterium]
MTDTFFTVLAQRGVLSIAGDDRRSFLQGLTSNDVTRVTERRVLHAALLTPQGRFLHEFFVAEAAGTLDGALLLDAEAARLGDLATRLGRFRLRARVTLTEAGDLGVAVVFGPGAAGAFALVAAAGAAGPFAGGIACVDPRLADAGVRIIAPRDRLDEALSQAGLRRGTVEDYDRHRLALGLPDGSRDMLVEKSLLLEGGFEELNGVDFDKGCYMGQELTARTKHRGLVRRRLVPVAVEGPLPAPGTPIMDGAQEAGEMRS